MNGTCICACARPAAARRRGVRRRRPGGRTRGSAGEQEPVTAIDAAVASLHESIDGLFPSVFVLEHGHLWLVAQRGYAVVPDGIGIEQGVLGRAARHGRGQLVIDVHSDPDYLEVLPAVASEATVPLRVDRVTVGVLNLDSERPLPEAS